MNLYLYIPLHFAYPPGISTGLMMDNMMRMHILCLCQNDIHEKLGLFSCQLMTHGYNREVILPIFKKAIANTCTYIKHGCPKLQPAA
jgi:hypothetical protein